MSSNLRALLAQIERQIQEMEREHRMEMDDLARRVSVGEPPKPGEICPCCKVRKFTWPNED